MAQAVTDGFIYSNVTFPDSFINPTDKGREWHMQYAQAAYGLNFQNQYVQSGYAQWRLNRLFAQGRQPIQRYVTQLCGEGVNVPDANNPQQNNQVVESGDKGANYMNINWRIVSVMPKIRDSVINYVNKIKFRAQFNATNPAAIEKKNSDKYELWAEKVLESDIADIEAAGNFQFTDKKDTSWIPDDFEEFEALAHTKIKLKEEIRAELGCSQVFDENEWKIIERRLDEDGFDLAFEAVECRTNKFTGKIDVNYINPEQLIMPTFSGKVGEDIWIVGVVERISLYQLYQEAGSQYTPEDYKLIAQTYRGQYGNVWDAAFDWYGTLSNTYSSWKSFTILRQKLYWYDVNVKKYTAVTKGDGDPRYKWRDFNAPPRNETKVIETGETVTAVSDELQAQIVRECMWVVGTKFIHNWGKLRDVSREQMDKRQSMLPIKVYKIADQSRVERAIPYIDNVCLTWYRLQDRIARAMPPGVIINLDAFEKLMIDQKEWGTQKLLDLAVQSGIIFTRVTDTMMPDNGAQPLPAVQPHEGSMIGVFAEYINAMDASIAKIKETTGINDILDGTTPESKTLVGVAQMSYNSVLNSISELVFCRQYLFEKTSLDIAGKLQLKARDGDIQMYSKQLGDIITIPQSLSLFELGIKCEAVPTDKDKEQMKMMLSQALQTTGVPLDFDDLYYINNLIDNCDSLKLAEKLINVRINKRRAQIQKDQQQNIQQQNQGLQQMEQGKQQAAMDMIVFQNQQNMDFEQFLTGEIIKRGQADSMNRIQQTAVHSDLKDKEATHKHQLDPAKV